MTGAPSLGKFGRWRKMRETRLEGSLVELQGVFTDYTEFSPCPPGSSDFGVLLVPDWSWRNDLFCPMMWMWARPRVIAAQLESPPFEGASRTQRLGNNPTTGNKGMDTQEHFREILTRNTDRTRRQSPALSPSRDSGLATLCADVIVIRPSDAQGRDVARERQLTEFIAPRQRSATGRPSRTMVRIRHRRCVVHTHQLRCVPGHFAPMRKDAAQHPQLSK